MGVEPRQDERQLAAVNECEFFATTYSPAFAALSDGMISDRASELAQSENSLTMRLTLWPPKPNELLIATRTFFSRAVRGT